MKLDNIIQLMGTGESCVPRSHEGWMQAVKKIKRTVNMKAAATEDTGGKKNGGLWGWRVRIAKEDKSVLKGMYVSLNF